MGMVLGCVGITKNAREQSRYMFVGQKQTDTSSPREWRPGVAGDCSWIKQKWVFYRSTATLKCSRKWLHCVGKENKRTARLAS